MRRPTHAVAVAVVLALGGCAVGPDFETPHLPTPVEYRGVLSPQDATSFADQHWAEVFNDPGLQAVIETALGRAVLRSAATRHILPVA